MGPRQLERRSPPARIIWDGRGLITRAELARVTGLSEQHLAGLYSQRADSGHPEMVHREGQILYFDEAQVREWHERYRQAKFSAVPSLTPDHRLRCRGRWCRGRRRWCR